MDKAYFGIIKPELDSAYRVAEEARKKGLDPSLKVEVPPAADLAARIEGIVGPKGVAEKIRSLSGSREQVARRVVDSILGGELGKHDSRELLIEQALRTALALLTEGVVAAPLEGISRVTLTPDPEGEYLSVFFAGPIRSAGGTAQALAVIIAEYIREKIGIGKYHVREKEVERYVEEIRAYHERVSRLQYFPNESEIKKILPNLFVCVDGDPTADLEVSINKDLERVATNRIRGGVCLVLCEGIAQKAKKVRKLAKEFDLDWHWLKDISKVVKKKEEETEVEIKPSTKYLEDIVAGRPIFSHPMARGGFRLRYGRCRTSGIAAKAIHPATMVLLGGFPAIGCQLKLERPGKGMVAVPCDTIEGPVVLLDDGELKKISSVEEAEELKNRVEKILFLGDLLVSYGDFRKANVKLVPSAYCEEYWEAETGQKTPILSAGELLKHCVKNKLPLHPALNYPFHDLSVEELLALRKTLSNGKKQGKNLVLEEGKELLEKLLVPHRKENEKIVITEPDALLCVLAVGEKKQPKKTKDPLAFVNSLSPIPVRDKTPLYVGSRMGRPEKAKERLMTPAPHVLFPLGKAGGKTRSVAKAKEKNRIFVDIAKYNCPKCGRETFSPKCPECGERTSLVYVCPRCGRHLEEENCRVCGAAANTYDHRALELSKYLQKCEEKLNERIHGMVKGVLGLTNKNKIPENLEKGILRAKNNVFVFKDGTIRFDATDIPLTHFRPREIGVEVDVLKKLGYEKDHEGKKLENADQLVKLKPQDIVLPRSGATYLYRVSKFVDDLLEKTYGLKPFYNLSGEDDLAGHLVVGLAPHTSVGILGRVVGFSQVNGLYAHPYFHTAKRRNCDGDEDSVMLLLDVLLNFSREYLPESRGGRMDAPLVLTTVLDPKEVDDEVHDMEIVSQYPLDFYEQSFSFASPSDLKIDLVRNVLGTEAESGGIGFTHDTLDINHGVLTSTYKTLATMAEKVDAQLELAEKTLAVDAKDVAERVLNQHFFRDLVGNLRTFGKQKVRCVDCNSKYRRVPLVGKCTRCGGKLVLTIHRGSVEKYLEISKKLVEKYGLSDYIRQRLELAEMEIESVFENDKVKQYTLDSFM